MLKTNGDRFEYEMNVLLDATREKIKIIEVPIETIYIENNKSSHYKVVRDSFMIYKQIFNFKFKRKWFYKKEVYYNIYYNISIKCNISIVKLISN